MADRAANAASIRVNVSSTQYKIKVTRWNLDTELRYRRSITSDFDCVPLSVFETCGGIIRGVGFVDPTNTITALILQMITGSVVAGNFDFTAGQLVLDVMSESAGNRIGFSIGNCKLFLFGLGGVTDDAGMIEMQFEVHPKGKTVASVPMLLEWQTNMT